MYVLKVYNCLFIKYTNNNQEKKNISKIERKIQKKEKKEKKKKREKNSSLKVKMNTKINLDKTNLNNDIKLLCCQQKECTKFFYIYPFFFTSYYNYNYILP